MRKPVKNEITGDTHQEAGPAGFSFLPFKLLFIFVC